MKKNNVIVHLDKEFVSLLYLKKKQDDYSVLKTQELSFFNAHEDPEKFDYTSFIKIINTFLLKNKIKRANISLIFTTFDGLCDSKIVEIESQDSSDVSKTMEYKIIESFNVSSEDFAFNYKSLYGNHYFVQIMNRTFMNTLGGSKFKNGCELAGIFHESVIFAECLDYNRAMLVDIGRWNTKCFAYLDKKPILFETDEAFKLMSGDELLDKGVQFQEMVNKWVLNLEIYHDIKMKTIYFTGLSPKGCETSSIEKKMGLAFKYPFNHDDEEQERYLKYVSLIQDDKQLSAYNFVRRITNDKKKQIFTLIMAYGVGLMVLLPLSNGKMSETIKTMKQENERIISEISSFNEKISSINNEIAGEKRAIEEYNTLTKELNTYYNRKDRPYLSLWMERLKRITPDGISLTNIQIEKKDMLTHIAIDGKTENYHDVGVFAILLENHGIATIEAIKKAQDGFSFNVRFVEKEQVK